MTISVKKKNNNNKCKTSLVDVNGVYMAPSGGWVINIAGRQADRKNSRIITHTQKKELSLGILLLKASLAVELGEVRLG